jgi:hypothetical protein
MKEPRFKVGDRVVVDYFKGKVCVITCVDKDPSGYGYRYDVSYPEHLYNVHESSLMESSDNEC